MFVLSQFQNNDLFYPVGNIQNPASQQGYALNSQNKQELIICLLYSQFASLNSQILHKNSLISLLSSHWILLSFNEDKA